MSILKILRVATAVSLCFAAITVLATDRNSYPGSTRVDSATQRPRIVHVRAHAANAVIQPQDLIASNYRAYPPSCFSDILPSQAGAIEPLDVTPSGTLYSSTVTLQAYDTNNPNTLSTENVTITVWRVPCGNSTASLPYSPNATAAAPVPVSATLMRIQRQSQYEGDTSYYPEYPDVRVAQGSIAFDNPNGTDYVRSVSEPNTVLADTQVYQAVSDSTTFVLENYAPQDGFTPGNFNFNQAFSIRFDNYISDVSGVQQQFVINVPAYQPNQTSYPSAYTPLPINGYMSGSWYDSTHSGEGILTQVLDNGDGVTRTFFATWYTYDAAGVPYWLVAQTSFSIGATQLTNVPVQYVVGGTFGGNSVGVSRNPWGTMNFSFPNCGQLAFSYNSTNSDANAPKGNGSLTWSRLGSINSLSCQ